MNISHPILAIAKAASPPLANALARFEALRRRCGDEEGLQARIAIVWDRVASDAAQGIVSLQSEYLSSLHQDISRGSPCTESTHFRQCEVPNDWNGFLSELFSASAVSIQGNEAWVIAKLVWGKHLDSFEYSLAWLVVSGLRMQEGLPPLLPPTTGLERLVFALNAAGPPSWDAETLRSVLDECDEVRLGNSSN